MHGMTMRHDTFVQMRSSLASAETHTRKPIASHIHIHILCFGWELFLSVFNNILIYKYVQALGCSTSKRLFWNIFSYEETTFNLCLQLVSSSVLYIFLHRPHILMPNNCLKIFQIFNSAYNLPFIKFMVCIVYA